MTNENDAPAVIGPVGGYELLAAREDAILLCARVIHETVKALNDAHNELTLDWDSSRDSIISGINKVLENPTMTPAQQHEAWMEYRRADGWVYGLTKDPVRKTHPCMVPYLALPPIQQAKDMMFRAIVTTFFGL